MHAGEVVAANWSTCILTEPTAHRIEWKVFGRARRGASRCERIARLPGMFDASTLAAALDDDALPADYRSIFDARGDAYHRAMVEFPGARQQEFEHIVRVANVRAGQVVCDAPSGGGYLPATCRWPTDR